MSKKKNIKKAFALSPLSPCLVFFLIFPLKGQAQEPSLNQILPPLSLSKQEILIQEGELLRFHPQKMSPELLPNTALSAAIARRLIRANLTLGIEGLFFIDKLPPAYHRLSPAERPLLLYNILRSVSSLTGLEYYSASRKKMRLLFKESWFIDNPHDKNPVDSLILSSLPTEEHLFIHQKDKSFGKSHSEMLFRSSSSSLASSITNLSPLHYKGIFRVVNSGDMQTHLIIIPVQEGLLIYGALGAKTKKVNAFLNRAQNSFTNRMLALVGWYKKSLQEKLTAQ